jgi:alcohol dehydrogenase class IV
MIDMSKERSFLSPRTLFGSGYISYLGPEARRFGIKNAVVFTTNSVINGEFAASMRDSLNRAGVSTNFFIEIEPEPSVATAERAFSFAKERGADGVIGIGGGSVLDVSKAVAAAATNGGLAACAGVNSVKNPTLPLILAPTTAGTGSEATTVSVLIDAQGKKFVIYSPHLLPSSAIIDPLLTHTMPKDVTVHSGMDAMCHAVEACLSINSSKASEATALSAIGLLSDALSVVATNPKDAAARHDMALGAHLAGVAMTNSGIEVDGCPIAGASITHAVGLATGARYGLPHGLSVGMVLPHSMAALKGSSRQKLEKIGIAMGTRPSAEEAIEKVHSIIKDTGMKRNLTECGKNAAPDIDKVIEDSLAAKRLLANCSGEIGSIEMRAVVEKIM